MAADSANECTEVAGSSKFLSDHVREDVVAKDVPCSFPRFVTVKRTFGSRDFAVSGLGSIPYPEQHNMAVLRRTPAPFEWMQQPHSQLAHFNFFDEHAMLRE